VPLYDYMCTNCERTVEVMHGVHAHGPKTCEYCGGPMRKLLSPPAIVFKGSGWAKKDARASHSSAKGSKGSHAPSTDASSGDSPAKPSTGDAAPAAPKSDASGD